MFQRDYTHKTTMQVIKNSRQNHASYQKFKARGRYASHGDWFGFFLLTVSF